MGDEAEFLSDLYSALLEIPLSSPWRATHQHVYAAVRDRLAEALGDDAEDVQTSFEAAEVRRQMGVA